MSNHELQLHNFDTTVCTVGFCFRLRKVVEISIKIAKVVVNLHNFLMVHFFLGVLTN